MILLLSSCELHSQNYFWGQNIIEMYTPSVFRYNLSFKITLAPLLSRKWCKKYGETLSFPSKICRLTLSSILVFFLDHGAFLSDINIRIEQGEMLTIVGIVGSGKSALLKALLGEMVKVIYSHGARWRMGGWVWGGTHQWSTIRCWKQGQVSQ